MSKNLAALMVLSLASLASANPATRADISSIIKKGGFQEASCRAVAGGLGEVCAHLNGTAKASQDKLHATATKLGWKLKGKWSQDMGVRSGTYTKGSKLINFVVNDSRPLMNLAFISGAFEE